MFAKSLRLFYVLGKISVSSLASYDVTRRDVVTLPLYYFVMGHWSIRVTSETFNIPFRDTQPGMREPKRVHKVKSRGTQIITAVIKCLVREVTPQGLQQLLFFGQR